MQSDIHAPGYKTRPYWWDAVELPALCAGPEDLPAKTDVLIVGGGYSGLSAALTLARGGREVTLIDSGHPGYGCSARNGGLVGPSFHKLGLDGLSAAYGEKKALELMRESLESLNFLKTFLRQEKIECGFHESGRFQGAASPNHYERLARRVDGLNKVLDLQAEIVPKAEQHAEIGSERYHGGAVYTRDGHLHPGLFAAGLAERAKAAGAALFGKAPMTAHRREAEGWEVEVAGRRIAARELVIATNGYTGKVTGNLRRRVLPIRSAIIATEELPEELAKSLSPKNRGLGETFRLFHYYRPSPDGRRMIFGGRAPHLDDRPESYSRELYADMLKIYPQLEGYRITHAWSGTVAYSFDHAPHLGQMDGLWYVMGYCGSGVGRATYFGRKLGLKMLGDPEGRSPLDDLPFPTRPLYSGHPWFLPAVIRWHAFLDSLGL